MSIERTPSRPNGDEDHSVRLSVLEIVQQRHEAVISELPEIVTNLRLEVKGLSTTQKVVFALMTILVSGAEAMHWVVHR